MGLRTDINEVNRVKELERHENLDKEFIGFGFTEKTRQIFSIWDSEFFALWYQKSFETETPLSNTDKTDIVKWVKRFKEGTPFTEMDDIRRAIYVKEIQNRYNF